MQNIYFLALRHHTLGLEREGRPTYYSSGPRSPAPAQNALDRVGHRRAGENALWFLENHTRLGQVNHAYTCVALTYTENVTRCTFPFPRIVRENVIGPCSRSSLQFYRR